MSKLESGFSLLEILTVIALVGICSSVAVIQLRSTVAILDADKAANLVISQVSYARTLAVDQRRNVRLDFLGANEIKVTRLESGGGETTMSDVTLPSGYSYGLPSGIGDTPDGLNPGMTAAVNFNSATTGTFLGDGTFVDGSSVLLSGSVFTKGSGNGSVRAITLAGATGRIKQYAIQGTSWVAR